MSKKYLYLPVITGLLSQRRANKIMGVSRYLILSVIRGEMLFYRVAETLLSSDKWIMVNRSIKFRIIYILF